MALCTELAPPQKFQHKHLIGVAWLTVQKTHFGVAETVVPYSSVRGNFEKP